MESRGLDLLVAFSSPGSMRFGQRGHVMYLSGYEPYFGNNMMIFPVDGDREPLLQVDSADFFPSQCTDITRIVHAEDPIDTINGYMQSNGYKKPHIGIVGEYSISVQLIQRIEGELDIGELSYASDILENERVVKSDFEIDCIKKASSIARKGFEAAGNFTRSGITEAQIVSEVERVCREEGSEGFPHYTMVSSGENEKHLEWWWYCGRRKLLKGDTWNLDYGTMYMGYCCDIARSFHIGQVPKKLRDCYNVLIEAEKAGQKAARSGVLGSEVNDIIIEVMSGSFEGDFSGIGHGVGLEVHEWPFVGYHYIRNDPIYADRKLENNMVISLEPQVFVPDIGYIQIEDEFLVTSAGGIRLNGIPREVIES